MGFNPEKVLQEVGNDFLPPKPPQPTAPAAVDVLEDDRLDDGHVDGTVIEDHDEPDADIDEAAPEVDPEDLDDRDEPTKVRPGPKPTRGRRSPSVDLPESLGKRYKKVWQDGIAKGNKRTYTEILFDAIEAQAPELAVYWKAAAEQHEEKATSLFPSRNRQPKRLTRDEPTQRFTFAGLTAADRKVLDKLEEQWGAPSFVALVIAALDLDLPQVTSNRGGNRGRS